MRDFGIEKAVPFYGKCSDGDSGPSNNAYIEGHNLPQRVMQCSEMAEGMLFKID